MRRLTHFIVFTFPALAAPAFADGGGSYAPHASLNVARQETGAARIGDRVYVVGGLLAGWTASDTIEVYDIAADTWSFGPQLPAPRHHAMVAAHGTRLFVIGGYPTGFSPLDTVFVLDTQTGTWSTAAPLPARRAAGWAVTFGSAIYVFAGQGPAGATRTTYRYDTAANTWSQVADVPTAREHTNAAALGDWIHVVGGRAGAASSANERYHPASDTWEVRAPMPTARSAMALAAFEGRLFALGGEVPMLFDVNEAYDPVLDTWSTQAPMPLARHGIAAVTLDDRILLPAGGTVQGLAPTATCDSFVPEPHAGALPFCFCASAAPCGNLDPSAGCANSTGGGALLAACGSASVQSDDLVLVATGLPANQFGLAFMGPGTTALPLGDGRRCVDFGGVGLFRFPVRNSGAAGTITEGPGLAAFTAATNPPAGRIVTGATWNFQIWYRDPGGCGSGSNLSNALAVTFVP